MSAFSQISAQNSVLHLIACPFKWLWEINETHWMNPLILMICWPVMFNVTAALFPPIENTCWLNSSTIVPAAFSNEGDQP